MQEQKKYNLADGNIRKRFVTYKQAAELYSIHISDDIFWTYKSQKNVQRVSKYIESGKVYFPRVCKDIQELA